MEFTDDCPRGPSSNVTLLEENHLGNLPFSDHCEEPMGDPSGLEVIDSKVSQTPKVSPSPRSGPERLGSILRWTAPSSGQVGGVGHANSQGAHGRQEPVLLAASTHPDITPPDQLGARGHRSPASTSGPVAGLQSPLSRSLSKRRSKYKRRMHWVLPQNASLLQYKPTPTNERTISARGKR